MRSEVSSLCGKAERTGINQSISLLKPFKTESINESNENFS